MQTQTIHYIPSVARTSNVLRVAAYARVSSDSSDQLESYAAQVQHYEQLIRQSPNWEMVDIYADEGLTGTRADTRVEFQRMLKDCRRGRIDKVLTKSISRFARNTRDTLTSIRELKALGVEVFFEKERIDTGAVTSEMLISFYGAAAQEESLSISGNMRWSYQRRMKSGEFITCKTPYGYRLSEGMLYIDEAEALVVRRIFEEYLAGQCLTSIVEKMTAESIPKRGVCWSVRAVEYILRNEKYAGNALLQKTYNSDELPFRKIYNKGERTMYYVENSHPAIITKEIFQSAQELMQSRRSETSCGEYPFSLMVYCGECGSSFKRREKNGKAYWACRKHDMSKDRCLVGRIPELALERAFARMCNKLRLYRHDILSPMLEQLTTLRQRAAFQQGRIVEIDNEILNIGRQTMLIHRLYGAGHMDTAHYYEQCQNLNSQVNILRRERQRLIDDERNDEAMEQTSLLLDVLHSSSERLDSFDVGLFHDTVRRITVTGQGLARFELVNGLEVTEIL